MSSQINEFREGILISSTQQIEPTNTIPITFNTYPYPTNGTSFSFNQFFQQQVGYQLSTQEKDLLSKDNIDLAKCYFIKIATQMLNNLIQQKLLRVEYRNNTRPVSQRIILFILSFTIDNNRFPTINDIADHFIPLGCTCLIRDETEEYSNAEIRNIFRICIIQNNSIPSCQYLKIALDYYRFYKYFPTDLDIQEQFQLSIAIAFSHAIDEKEDNPTINLDKLKKNLMTTEKLNEGPKECSICQMEILVNQKFYTLPPCNHNFHATDKDCLGESCVIDWLKKDTRCPNCRHTIIIKDDGILYDE